MSTLNPTIQIVPGDVGACGIYRLINPGYMMQASGMDVSVMAPGKFKGNPDIIYTQRICSEGSLKPLLDFKNRTGVKLIVDYDDLVFNYKGQGLTEYNWCNTKVNCEKNSEAMKKYANDVIDKATVSTTYLKTALSEYIDERKITVVPNRLMCKEWLFDKTATIPQDDIFFYAGSNTHYNNELKLKGDFSDGLIRYLQNKKILTMSSTPWFLKPIKQFPGVPMTIYARSFCNIARASKFVLAPLADNFFNKCKSNLKFLECCAIGRVCLVSDFEGCPYSEVAHPLQKIPVNATYKAIEYIVEEAKKHYGEILEHQYKVLQDYWLDNHIEEYKQILK